MIQKKINISELKVDLRKSSLHKIKSIPSEKRGYTKISEIKRYELIEVIEKNQMTIKEAARSLKINYSTAKNIVKIFRQERRSNVILKNSQSPVVNESLVNNEESDLKRFVARRTHLILENTQMLTPNLIPEQDYATKIAPEVNSTGFDFSIYLPLIYSR